MIADVPFTAFQLRRYSALECALLSDLRNLMQGTFDRETRRAVIIVLDALLDTLPREFQLKENGGYLTVVLEEYPNWDREVEILRNEHASLLKELQRLRDSLARCPAAPAGPMHVHGELKGWVNTLIAHNRHETRLLHAAVNTDVGVGD